MKKPFMIFLTAFAASFALCAASSSTTFNVRDFGAKGDGKTDDTAAVQRALNKLDEERVKQKMILGNMGGLPCGVWHGPCGELYFPKGIYRITSTLVGESGLKITGEDGSILDASGLKAPTLYLHKAFNVTVENMTFHGGETQILFWTANQDSAAIVIRASTFRASTGHAVVSVSYADADTSDPAKWNRIRPVAPYEITWNNGMPKLKIFGNVLFAETDLFINLSTSTDFTHSFISAVSKAKMKIGAADYPGNPFDIVMTEKHEVQEDEEIETVRNERTGDKIEAILKFIGQII